MFHEKLYEHGIRSGEKKNNLKQAGG